jgi:hypothetical protein
MATIQINCYPLLKSEPGIRSISLSLGETHPSKKLDVKTVKEAEAAVAEFAKVIEALGKPYYVTPRVVAGRRPNGWTSADLGVDINVHLAKER